MVAENYGKDVEGVTLDYMPSDIRDYDGGDFDIRISFGDDPLDMAFWITAPGDAEGLTLRQLIDQHVMGTTREDRQRIKEALDTDNNPDLPEMYLAVRRAFDDMARGKAVVRFHINKGPRDINLDEPVWRHFSRAYSREYDLDYRVIDLVLDVIDTAGALVPTEQQEEMKREFRALVLLYLMDRFGQDFGFEGRNFDKIGVEAVADWAVMKGWLDLSAKDVRGEYMAVYARTAEGNKIVRGVVRETDELIKNYDHYGDATLEEPPRFRTGRGEDLRIWVYKAEGVDPVRGVFLMNLENGFYDKNWERIFADDAFFRELLSIAGSPSPVSPQKLDRILRAGRTWAAQHRDEAERESRASELWGRDDRW